MGHDMANGLLYL